jgi:hypothetical protein
VFESDIRVVWWGYEEAGEGNSSALTGGRCSGAAMVLYMAGCRRLVVSSNQRSCWVVQPRDARSLPRSLDLLPTSCQPRTSCGQGGGEIGSWHAAQSARPRDLPQRAAGHRLTLRHATRWSSQSGERFAGEASMICSMGQGVDAAAMPWRGVSVAIEWAGDDDGAK